MKRVADMAGGLDILVNNAGILRDRTVKKMSPDEWHSVLETNLDGVFYCSKLGAEILRDGGRIVNIASISGMVGFHGQANYAAAKAGVIALTKVLAKELARRGITVNAVAPGVIQTPMLAGHQARGDGRVRKANPRRPHRPARRRGPRRALLGLRGERLHHRPDPAHHGRMVLKTAGSVPARLLS